MQLSPHEYNDTFAHMFSPLSKEEASRKELKWIDDALLEYATTKKAHELPDHIRDASDAILQDVIQCEICPRGYRVSKQELNFLRKHNLPLPRQCPFCRIEAKVQQWVLQMTLVDRTCDKCGNELRTHYTKEDAPVMYCKECYLEAFV